MKLVWAIVLVPAMWAVKPQVGMRQYLHTSWTQEEGTPLPPVLAMAQTRDGYLWLGTNNGLIRFDGMRFSEWKPGSGSMPGGDIQSLQADSDGSLWVGTPKGVAKIVHDRVINFPALDSLPCRTNHLLREDPGRGWWVLNECPERTLLALVSGDGTVKTFGTAEGVSEHLDSVARAQNGDLWLAGRDGICRWTPGRKAECFPGTASPSSTLLIGGDGTLLVAQAGKRQVLRFTAGRLEVVIAPLENAAFNRGAVLPDRDGNLWIGTAGQGLLRVRDGRVDRFTADDGLSSNMIHTLFEDSEGDLWVGTARGIDRIRDPKFTRLSTREGLSGDFITSVFASNSGVWVGTAGNGLNLVQASQIRHPDAHPARPGASVTSLYEDPTGRLWSGTSAGVTMRMGDTLTEVLTPGGDRLGTVFNIGGDASGAVWLLNQGGGLYQVRGSQAYAYTSPPLELNKPYRMMVTRAGDVWIGSYGGGITVIAKDSVRRYGAREGLGGGAVHALFEDAAGTIWAGTAQGLTHFENGRFTAWTAAQGLPAGGVLGIVDDVHGNLWLTTASEVLRVERATLKPGAPPRMQSFSRADGLRLSGVASMSPVMARDRSGQIWVSTQDGVAVFDPEQMRRNTMLPPVTIEQVMVDGKPVEMTSPEIRFRGRNVQISYTAVSLMSPESVRFRYRLAGLDTNWIEGGSRRMMAYANLSPKRYRFRAIAANNDGVWNENGAEVVLYVEPYFYETWWFRLACAIAVVLIGWTVYRLRVRTLQARWELIAAERARFSRELHDSLLQGFSGVVYLLEAAVKQFDSAPQKSRAGLIKALDRADNSLAEARRLITDMRIPALEHNTLPEALRETTHQMVNGMPVDFEFEVYGSTKPGHYDVDANLFLIGREALANSLNHAGADRIRMELNYTTKGLGLMVEDNGSGFDPEEARAKSGHQGFRGMEERARSIGGALAVESRRGKGTKIVVRVPWT